MLESHQGMEMTVRSPSRQWNLIMIFILALGLGWIWFSKIPPGSTNTGQIALPRQGFLAPDFTLQDSSGKSHTLSELRGRPVLINLWASWCVPCRTEMPALERIYRQYKDQGFEILAVNATKQDSQASALALSQDLGLTFPVLFDTDGSISSRYELRALPTSFFVGSDGKIQEVVVGGPMSEALLLVRVENLLKNTSQKHSSGGTD